MQQFIGKATAYITHGDRLLVFRHVESPEAGIQVPGGTLEPGEDPIMGALREATEETGLARLEPVTLLGSRRFVFDDTPGGSIERHYVHLRCLEDTPERWIAWEHDPSDGSPGPIAFELYWVPLSHVPQLMPSFGDLLAAIGGRECAQP